MASSREYLIVDAYSVIYAWPEFRALHHRRLSLAREALIRALTDYHDYTGIHTVVVFDGQGAKPTEATEPGGIQIFYSGNGLSADSIIERLVAKYAKERPITVATGDLLEAQTVITFGGMCISPETLYERLEEASQGFRRDLERHRRGY